MFAVQGCDGKRSYATYGNGNGKIFVLILRGKECTNNAACAYRSSKKNATHTPDESQHNIQPSCLWQNSASAFVCSMTKSTMSGRN